MASQSPKSPLVSPSKTEKTSSPKTPGSPAVAGQATSPIQEQQTLTNVPIAADESPDETLDLENSASSSASITSSIFRYRYENGRRYHAYKDGSYPIPNDEIETERLDLQHTMFQHLTFGGRLFLAPIDPDKVQRVLDCGTGTGSWAIDFADDHPNARVIGVDLSAIQPPFVPPNVEFFVDDLEDAWTYSAPFDFIYARMLTGSLADFPRFFQQSFENLAPGGWIELADITFPLECDDDTLPPDNEMLKWSEAYLEGSIKLNRRTDSAKFYAEQLKAAGFVNVVEEKFRWPINHWPKEPKVKELGLWMYENLGRNLSGLSLGMFTRGLGWSATQLEVYLVEVRKQMKDPKYHAYSPIYVVYAQKPGEES